MKKIIALIIALALVMGLAITASAQTVDAGAGGLATITITNASRGETYSVYKVFGATVTGTENGSIAYTGTVPSELAGCFEADAAGYISKKDGVTDEVILGALKTWATTADAVKSAKTVVWNGPMGVFENPILAKGTIAVAKSLAETDAVTIIGGGDSAAAVNTLGFGSKMTHISTGGGASLEFLEGKALPGIEAVNNK